MFLLSMAERGLEKEGPYHLRGYPAMHIINVLRPNSSACLRDKSDLTTIL